MQEGDWIKGDGAIIQCGGWGKGLSAQISQISGGVGGGAASQNKDLLGRSEKRENNLLNFMDYFEELSKT